MPLIPAWSKAAAELGLEIELLGRERDLQLITEERYSEGIVVARQKLERIKEMKL